MLRYLFKAVGVAGYIAQYACFTHCTFEYIGDFVICSGPSMEPTLFSNNVLVTERISARLHRLERGDIIIAKCPTNPNQHICKRVVGLPGDRIIAVSDPLLISTPPPASTNKNDPTINNKRKIKSFSEPGNDLIQLIEDEKKISIEKRIPLSEIVVPRGHVWIEGDNTQNSSDSRYFGPIPQGLIKSRAVCRLWPMDKIQLLI